MPLGEHLRHVGSNASRILFTDELLDVAADSLAHRISDGAKIISASSPEIPKGVVWTTCRRLRPEGFKPFLRENMPHEIPTKLGTNKPL